MPDSCLPGATRKAPKNLSTHEIRWRTVLWRYLAEEMLLHPEVLSLHSKFLALHQEFLLLHWKFLALHQEVLSLFLKDLLLFPEFLF